MHFVFIACQVEDYRNILKTSAIKKWAPGIKINISNKSKVKILETYCQRVFCGKTQKRMILIAWMEAKIQLDSSIVFKVFKFKTSDNLIEWELLPDNGSRNKQILVASMDIQQNAKNFMQKINKISQPFPEILVICYFREFWSCQTIPN